MRWSSPARAVIGTDRQQPGELALAAGVGLDADRVVARDLGEPELQLADQLAETSRLVVRREGMEVGELGPGDRLHLGGRVELHRARAERDHRPVEGEIPIGEPAEVAQHLVLGVVAVEHGLGEDGVGASSASRQPIGALVDRAQAPIDTERGQHPRRDIEGRRLVERESHGPVVDAARSRARRPAPRQSTASASIASTVIVSNHVPWRSESPPAASAAAVTEVNRWTRSAMRREAVGSVPRGVEPGDVGEQHLGGADVGRRLLAADVLLARLQGEPQRRSPGGVGAHAHDPPGQGAGGAVVGGDERGVRSAEAHRDPEALGRSDGDVGTDLAGRYAEHAGEEVSGDHHDAAAGVHLLDRSASSR